MQAAIPILFCVLHGGLLASADSSFELAEQQVRDEIRVASESGNWGDVYPIALKFAESCRKGKAAEEYALELMRESAGPRIDEVATLRLARLYLERGLLEHARVILQRLGEHHSICKAPSTGVCRVLTP